MTADGHALPAVAARVAGLLTLAGAALVAYGVGATQAGGVHRSLWQIGGVAGQILYAGSIAVAVATGLSVVVAPRRRALLGPVLLLAAAFLPTAVSLWARGGLTGAALATLVAGGLALLAVGVWGVFDLAASGPMLEADRLTVGLVAFVALALAITWWAPYAWISGPSSGAGAVRSSVRQFTLDDRSEWASVAITVAVAALLARLLWASARARAEALAAVAVVLLITFASRVAPTGHAAGTSIERSVASLVVTALGALAAIATSGSSVPGPRSDDRRQR